MATLTDNEKALIQKIRQAAEDQGIPQYPGESDDDYEQRLFLAVRDGSLKTDVYNDDSEDEPDDDDDDALDDAFAELRRILPRRRMPAGEYTCAVVDVKYTELPVSDPQPSYVTLNLVVSKGRFKGKRIPLRIDAR